MYKLLGFLVILSQTAISQSLNKSDIDRCQKRAGNVEIIRDKWGIPHIYGKTDADAVFGLMYAQCEDDFSRVEMNYIEKLGRMSEIKGESELWNDLYIRMIIDSADAVSDFEKSPGWLKELLIAWADGINYYLFKNQRVRPSLLAHFKPWYPLLWTDGSIGAINTGNLGSRDLRHFYTGERPIAQTLQQQEDRSTAGSNGFAIGPKLSESGHAMLYINPHVTFYFRPEVQMVSGQGLQAYGAVTWGQFFIYQGFNEWCGWMHTSSNADVADTYIEKVVKRNKTYYYLYDGKEREVLKKEVLIRYLRDGRQMEKRFMAYKTHHGPIMGKIDDENWISVRSHNRDINSLMQSWLRTKAKGLEDFRKVMELKGNTSNNTVFADRKGNIAYWHGNFMPIRDTAFNWSDHVDGSIPRTEWKGLHKLEETVHLYNPASGWIQNCNSTPFSASGSSSPLKSNYPSYMAPDGENFRGVNAARLLGKLEKVTIDKLIAAGYDTHMPAFEVLIPSLIRTFDRDVPVGNVLYNEISEAISLLRTWDYRCSESSMAATLAIEWGQRLNPVIQRVYIDEGEKDQVEATRFFADNASQQDLLLPFRSVVLELKEKFGTWRIPWGEINRYQRITGNIKETYNDSLASLPVGFASATWGCLPSYVSRPMQGTKKRYGISGNSFICAVEFGTKVKAKSLLAGGLNNNPASPHFSDQAEMFTRGNFKEVLFYREDVLRYAERSYRPGK